MVAEQLVAVVVEGVVAGAEPGQQRALVVGGLGLGPVHGGPVERGRQRGGPAHQPHPVGAGVQPRHAVRREQLAVVAAHAADVQRAVLAEQHAWQHRRPVHGAGQRLHRRVGRDADGGVEQRLDVHQHRLVAARDQVLVVHVGAVDRVEQGDQRAQPVVEPADAGHVRARGVRDELQPAVGRPGQRPGHPQAQVRVAVEPDQQLAEGGVQGDRARLVDDLAAVLERQHGHRAATLVGVAPAGVDGDHRAGVAAVQQLPHDRGTILREPVQQLPVRLHGVQAGLPEQPGQHRVLGEQLRQVQVAHEVREPLLGRLAVQFVRQALEVELQHQRAGGDPGQPVPQAAGEVVVQPGVLRLGRAHQGAQRERERLVPVDAAAELSMGRGRGGAFHERGPCRPPTGGDQLVGAPAHAAVPPGGGEPVDGGRDHVAQRVT
ncbi:hypothetical protein FHS29_005821 [Saccharothrix tamanrassetensis]|uniref:Uncharacterized protein n=1 Tax=Saccharothrix tamanrassetensis TaxID=1051531 RepID=A0A841CNH2_9PSEU|nr:hypothetical protein [Saccharothrix tamanrassetensis]